MTFRDSTPQMHLEQVGDLFVFHCSYDQREIPKTARFWWNQARKRWETQSLRCAARLMRYADTELRKHLIDRFARFPDIGQEMRTPGRRGRAGNRVRRP